MASITSPYTSSWSWPTAALPIRTGAEFSYPGSQSACQSTAPSRLIRAAVCMSPTSA
jgi:hypothetical protein